MTSSSVIPLLIFDLMLSFISGVVSLYYSYSSFSCSSSRFLTQPSVSLEESSEPRVISLLSPIYSYLFLNGGGVFFLFFYIRYTIHFWPFTWVVWYLNNLFSFDRSVWSFLSLILASNMLFVWCYTRYTFSACRHTINNCIVFASICFFGFFSFGTFIRKTGWWNIPLFIYWFYCVFYLNYFSRSWFIQWLWFI